MKADAPELAALTAKTGIPAEQLKEAMASSASLPATERARYRKMGWTVIDPGGSAGNFHGFPKAAWLPSSFLAKSPDGEEIQISLIVARRPGTGSFSALLYRLEKRLDLRVRIVAPLPQMASILERKGFVATYTGTTFEDRVDIWERPTATAGENL